MLQLNRGSKKREREREKASSVSSEKADAGRAGQSKKGRRFKWPACEKGGGVGQLEASVFLCRLRAGLKLSVQLHAFFFFFFLGSSLDDFGLNPPFTLCTQ